MPLPIAAGSYAALPKPRVKRFTFFSVTFAMSSSMNILRS
jgi:hypothetical protein